MKKELLHKLKIELNHSLDKVRQNYLKAYPGTRVIINFFDRVSLKLQSTGCKPNKEKFYLTDRTTKSFGQRYFTPLR